MKFNFGTSVVFLISAIFLAGCSGTDTNSENTMMATPTVDYIESLDVYSAPHQDSFLNQLAMNYRSYAIYNARTSGYSEIGEMFAQKAVAAFSGETPFPESIENWPIEDANLNFELSLASENLYDMFRNDATVKYPELSAEAQAKFDCWLSASASGQIQTANECRTRFEKALSSLRTGCKVLSKKTVVTAQQKTTTMVSEKSATQYYPETRSMNAMNGSGRARDSVIIVNNVNIPQNLINPVPVQPVVFNQNIFGGDKSVGNCTDPDNCPSEMQPLGEELVTRAEFIDMMMAMRNELSAINARLDKMQASGETTMIKVQQIPLEPKQHVMEEIFEVRFDFNKATIKPEYQELIKKLATATQENKNIKVSVIGHTDTVGTDAYNYALGGKRADSVQKMLVKYGIPAAQIVSVSAGEKDNKVKTGDGVKNAENRRVRVVKEVHYTEPAKYVPTRIEVKEYSQPQECGVYGCQ